MRSDTTGFWTPVALSADIPSGTVIPAHVSAGTIALWRSQAGQIAASADRCPHRGMSLSHGFVRGEALSCIYHGWSYGMSGHCVRIPAHPSLTPPETIRVVTHAVRDTSGVVWVAEGTPASDPLSLDGLTPLRSLTVEADRAAIEAAAGVPANADGLIEIARDGEDLCLLLSGSQQSQTGVRTVVHVLVATGSQAPQRIAASRNVERLRRMAETTSAEGNVP
ncbi:Rieske-like 2Fe-2S protein [Rhizobium sp. PP-F2F-G48]|uniref:Rieske 2Fe-2S domain-containing protein n=1 Tax=Rhizobium sp. PP-F2F-G48 TaxID=2135651 RepID=UPI00104CD2A1|nr:Rieske 2Fe-2S domain-containing protein [Rhizobium sp. PP-F2F-G48]TCM52195.1 Rieske-like 2Fe-2S protein [Rhizobium sp. PP-F2F-G48]